MNAIILLLLACSPSPSPAPSSAAPAASPEAPAASPEAPAGSPEAPAASPEAPAVAPTPPLAGGYGAAPITPEVEAAARFAVEHLDRPGATLAHVDAVEQQVVAGMNLRMALTLHDGTHWRVVVFRGLDGTLSLTSSEH